MPSPLFRPGALFLGLVVLGGPADAAGIGLNVSGYARNIPRAVAGAHSPRVGVQTEERAPSRLRLGKRSIETDTTGESTATRLRKCVAAVGCRLPSDTQGLK